MKIKSASFDEPEDPFQIEDQVLISPIEKKHPDRATSAIAAALLFLAVLFLSACGSGDGTSQATEREVTATRTIMTLTPATRPAEVIIRRSTEIPEVILTIPLPGQKELETEHFAFYVEDDYQPVDLELFAGTAEGIYAEVSAEMDAGSPEVIIFSFQPPEDHPCRARGTTLYSEPDPRVTIFANEQTDEAQILGVFAHEVAHVIHSNGFDRFLGGDRNLTEGLATWITRDYWTAWHQTESLDEMVRGYLASGSYVPLTEADVFSVHPQAQDSTLTNCLAQRDLLYTQWASFVGYLVNVYGWESFLDLMASAESEVTDEGVILPMPTDYEGVYGKTLEALEAVWISDLTISNEG